MKTFKNSISLKLAALVIIHLIASIFIGSNAFADDSGLNLNQGENIAAIRFSGLAPYKNQYVSVIYGINNSLLYNSSGNAYLTKIRVQTTPQLVTGDNVTVPSQRIERQGIFEGYTAIVVVLHTQPVLNWMNADNSVPQGASIGDQNDFTSVITITKKDYKRLFNSQGSPQIVNINLGGY